MTRLLISLFLLTTAAFGQSKPNIIFFLVDDLGYGDLGSFWQDQRASTKKFDTPALDRMAAEGAMLTHHYVSASVCAPSRASLLQGRHQGHSDVRNSQFDKALPDTHNIASVLKAAGYRTIHLGKGGLAGAETAVTLTGTGSQNLAAHPLHRGFDRFFGYLFHADGHEHYPRNGTTDKVSHIYDDYQQITNASLDLYTTDAWTAAAKKEIITEATDGDDQPFFLYLAYDTPHSKMQRPAVAYPALDSDGNPLTGGIQWTTATDGSGRVRYASTAVGTPPLFPHPAVDPYGYDHPDIPSDWATSEKQHVGMIRRIDESIADILQTLKDLGIDENTLCVFSSDNGPHNEGNNPRTFQSYANLEGIKRDMWEGGIRVPTIVRWPGKIAGATGNENNIHAVGYPSAHWDWMPTFCQMAGVPAPAWCDGVSLLPTLTGTGTQRDKGHLYFEFSNNSSTPNWTEFPNHGGETQGEMQAIRIGNHMGVRTGIATGNENFRIYDVTTDPGQGTNLAASLPAVQTKMKALAVTARRPGGGVTRPYDGLALPAETPSPTAPGVEWKSYIDATTSWQWVPEFRELGATASGTTGTPSVSVRPADDHFGLLFTGYIQIPTAGSYQFYLNSDTGADFFLHDGHLIADDFNHSGAVSSAAVNLSAGLHPFRLYYRHTTGPRTLSLEWSGPGIARQAVPSTAFFIEGSPPPGPPTANDDNATTSVDTSVLIDVLANDFDDGTPSPIAIQSVGTPTTGTAVIESGKIRYTPPAGFSGTATFSYTITDGDATDTAIVTVTVQIPLAPSRLVSYLPLDNASGITLTNGATMTSGTQGMFGEALSLDGVNDYAVVNSSPGISGNVQRTVCAWVYQDAGSSNLRTAVALGVNGTGTKWDLDIDNANAGIEVGVGGGRNVGSGLTGLTGQWMLVSSTLPTGGNLGAVKTYLNGTVTNAGTGGTTINTTNQAIYHLGVSANLGIQYLDGRIDDVSIWDVAFTADEIKCLYDVGNSIELRYTAAVFDQLKRTHDAGAGSVIVGEFEWTYASGLGGAAGLSGSGSNYTIVLNATAGTGLLGIRSSEVTWGGAGSQASPAFWDLPVNGSPGRNDDPTHWNRATPPDLTGPDDAVINGGGIQKSDGLDVSGGSTMTLNSGSHIRLNATSNNFNISSGASLLINDGTFESNTNAVTVAGASLELVSGSFDFNSQSTFGLGLNDGATVIVRAGGTIDSSTFFNSHNANTATGGTFTIDGGMLRSSGPQGDPVRAANGLDGGGYDFTSTGGTIQIDDFTGGDLTTYLQGKATAGFFKINGTTVTGFGPSHKVSGVFLALKDNGSSGSLTLTEPDFVWWINSFDWSGFTNPDLSPGGDPDGDGVDSGVENYFGTAPNSFSQGVVAGEKSGNQFTFTHPLNPNPASDLVPRYRWSADLVNFHDDGAPNAAGTTTVTFSDPVPAGNGVSVTATITGTVIPDRIFVRVEVTQN